MNEKTNLELLDDNIEGLKSVLSPEYVHYVSTIQRLLFAVVEDHDDELKQLHHQVADRDQAIATLSFNRNPLYSRPMMSDSPANVWVCNVCGAMVAAHSQVTHSAFHKSLKN